MTTQGIYPVTSRFISCDACGLPVNTCICSRVPALKTRTQIWILSTEKEFHRPSNTARLLKLMNPQSTEIHLWERTREPAALLEKLRQGSYTPFLLFPAETEAEEAEHAIAPLSEKPPAFIIIDGTWQEARKIIRKSHYLNALPRIFLSGDAGSVYSLRRGVKPGNLCTLEAAIEAVRMCGEPVAAEAMHGLYLLFLRSYKAGCCGHGLIEDGGE